MQAFGIDIGGSGIKGAPVDLETGALAGERLRLETPLPATPDAVAVVVKQLVDKFDWRGPIGCTFPAIVRHGVTLSAANVDAKWIGTNAVKLFEKATNSPVAVLNDADAAGVAEMTFGAGRAHHKGVVMMLTFGTGIGSALFVDGHLHPNTELGHLIVKKDKEAEHWCSAKIKKDESLSWEAWAERVNYYLSRLEFFFSPDLFIVGGGVSKKYDKFLHLFQTRAEVAPAQLLNDAGIIGAAMAARQLLDE